MNRRSAILLVILVALLIALGVVLYPLVHPSADIVAGRAPREIPNTDVHPLGANFFLEREVEAWKREETVHMARDAGIRWAKQQFVWAEIEPQPGHYRWEKYDAIVDLCESYGLRVIARLDGAPNWSRQDNSMPGRPPDDLADYGEFVYRFVEHYRGRVQHVQIWNEPNLYIEWGNRPVDPAGYVDLLRIAYQRAKEADPDVYVLGAPLAITLGEPHPEPGKWRAMNDLQFLEEMYEAGAAAYFDILAANAFGMDLPPDDAPSPSKLNFARASLQREIMVRYGDADKAVWFNEYAWNAAPASFAQEDLTWQRVSEEQQAAYTLQGLEYALENWPWAGVFNIWYFRQVGDIPPDQASYYFRMVDVDFIPRRIYFAIKDRAAQLSEAGPGYYEESSAAVQAPPSQWRTRIDPSASGGAVAISEQPGSNLALTFSGQQVQLIAWAGPEGGQMLVTLGGQNVSGLPTDAQGRSYVELYAPTPRRISLPVVQGAGARRQTLRLTVSDATHPEAQGRQCAVDAFQVIAAATPAFPVVPVVLLVVGCVAAGTLLGRATIKARAGR
ncbi:MAG: beta-galactosidase [Anaerolineae bacterium]|nr:beta-galactosidase [Anaerolineae bacterium]